MKEKTQKHKSTVLFQKPTFAELQSIRLKKAQRKYWKDPNKRINYPSVNQPLPYRLYVIAVVVWKSKQEKWPENLFLFEEITLAMIDNTFSFGLASIPFLAIYWRFSKSRWWLTTNLIAIASRCVCSRCDSRRRNKKQVKLEIALHYFNAESDYPIKMWKRSIISILWLCLSLVGWQCLLATNLWARIFLPSRRSVFFCHKLESCRFVLMWGRILIKYSRREMEEVVKLGWLVPCVCILSI